MTGLAEDSRTEPEQAIVGRVWREGARRAQEEALPPGRAVVSCSVGLGSGGLGRHAKEIVDAFDRVGRPAIPICGREDASLPARAWHERVWRRSVNAALALPPLHLAAGQRVLRHSREFDLYASERMPAAEHLIGFNGTSLEQLRAARRRGIESTAIVSATSHFRLLMRQHALAHRQYPLEESWATRVLERNLSEYAAVDRIYVSSRYVRDSFLAEGLREEVLVPFPLTPDPRFKEAPISSRSSTFDIVFVGSLSVVKGAPLLIDAVRALPHADMRLLLIGGWKSRGMRRFVEQACARDPRISTSHGDPLPHLSGARLCVHPTYNDGFGYAPVEAIACGVPALVSEDTGMKDLIEPGRNGLVLPTGDLAALTEALDAAYRGELLGG